MAVPNIGLILTGLLMISIPYISPKMTTSNELTYFFCGVGSLLVIVSFFPSLFSDGFSESNNAPKPKPTTGDQAKAGMPDQWKVAFE